MAKLLTPLIPDLITDLDTPLDPNHPALAVSLKRLAESAPQKPLISGLMFELRLRQQGRALDLLVGPRWVAPILHAVEQIYGEDAATVSADSSVTCVNESHTGILVIRHHDDDGRPIQEGQGHFHILDFKYARAVGEKLEEVALNPAEASRLLTLSEAELHEKHSLFRRVQLELLAPRSLLKRLLSDARQGLRNHDFEVNPACVFDYSSHFASQQFRLVPISLAYYENEIAIDDNGQVVRSERSKQHPEGPELSGVEWAKTFFEWLDDPKQEVFLALRQGVLRSPDYQPYKEPRPFEELRQAVGEHRHKDILDIIAREGLSLLLSPEAHMAATIAHKHMGNTELEQYARKTSKLCADAIEQTGDGSLDRPYLVLHVNDEYDFITRHELVPVRQGLVHHGGRSLDVFTLEDGRQVAFDVTDMQNAMFDRSSGRSSYLQEALAALEKESPRQGCLYSKWTWLGIVASILLAMRC